MSYNCRGCGAEIVYDPGSQSLKCPYCGIVNQIAKPEESKQKNNSKKIIPLKASQNDLDRRIYGYLASRNSTTPDDIISEAKIISRQFMYVPVYKFITVYEANWTASFGFIKQEQYIDQQSEKSPVVKAKSVIDWRPTNGKDKGIVSNFSYAGDNKKLPIDILMDTIEKGNMVDYNDSFLQGIETKGPTVPKENLIASLKNKIDLDITQNVKKHRQGAHQKEWYIHSTKSSSSILVYVPICHAVLEYKGTQYPVWMDGIGINKIDVGALPKGEEKVGSWWIFLLSVIALLATSYFWSFTLVGLGLAIFALLYVTTRDALLENESKSIRNSQLTQMQASLGTTNFTDDKARDEYLRSLQIPKKEKSNAYNTIFTLLILLGIVISSYYTNSNKVPLPPKNIAPIVNTIPEATEPTRATEQEVIRQEAPQPVTSSSVFDNQKKGIEKKLPANTIEAMDLLKMFAIDKDATHNSYDWFTGAEASSPINWIDTGIVEASENSDNPYERKGEVHVRNQGKITHQILGKKIEEGKWNITLRGPRAGYFIVDIESDAVTPEDPELLIDKRNIKEEIHCEESASNNTSMYLVQFINKKPFWIKKMYSSGSGGGANYYTITYDKKPQCDEKLTQDDESQVFNATRRCSNYIVTTEQLNIRTAPDESGQVVRRVNRGESVCIYSFSGKWGETDGGWISGKFLESQESSFSAQNIKLTDTQNGNDDVFNTYSIEGTTEQCQIRVFNKESIVETSCIRSINSKGIKILCTINSNICKTENEFFEFINSSASSHKESGTNSSSSDLATDSRQYSQSSNQNSLYVCYDRKITTGHNTLIYEGCIRSDSPCQNIRKYHFGKYSKNSKAQAAFERCLRGNPKFVDRQGL